MPEKERPLSTLEQLIEQKASGELICAASSLEVHVFLQHGRVAWCTESGKPFAFTRKLFELTELDRDAFRQILDECRRDRLPLGETLIEWRVASLEQVREALRHQIVDALTSLAGQDEAQVLFLERSRAFAGYDEALTFDLEDVMSPPAPSAPAPAEASSAQRDLRALIGRLQDEVSGVLWTAILERGRAIAWQPSPAPPAHVVGGVATHSLGDGADFVGVRTPLGTVLGTSLADGERSLWCGLSVESTFGAAFSALTSLLRLDGRAPAGDQSTGSGGLREEGSSDAAPVLLAFLERARDVLAVSLLGEDGRSEYRALREGADVGAALAAAARRRPILEKPELVDNLWPRGAQDDLGPLQKTLVTGEGQLWVFGAQLVAGLPGTLWLVTSRRTSQGLGWAYLSALGRQLAGRGGGT